ncbi:LamG domain-containing protein [Planctomycetota bacterium]
MKSTGITVCLCTFLWIPTITVAQKTEVRVHRGTVRAKTNIKQVNIEAGRKAIILPDGQPAVTVSDPLVDDVMELYKWVEEEKQAQRQRIDTFNITVMRIEDDEAATGASFAEFENYKSRASKTFTLNSNILDEATFYDLAGNLLSYELHKTSATHGKYTITHTQTVEPGENFRFIGVAKSQIAVDIDINGILRHLRPAWKTPYCLNFCRVILPPSAIFVESSRPVIAMENCEGRVSVTSRAYNGPMADGKFHFAFLWPERDNTRLTDLPGEFRGLFDTHKDAIDKEYANRKAAIITGQTVDDQSTPLLALLSGYSAVVHKNKQQLIDLIANPDYKEAARIAMGYNNAVLEQLTQGYDTYGFLNTPPYPKHPQQGDKHPIYLCRKGSLLHELTVEMVFQDGKWYLWNGEEVWTSRKEPEDHEVMDPVEVTPDSETLAAAQAKGFLTDWEVIGPYMQSDKNAHELFDIPFGPELSDSDLPWRPIPVEITDINGQDTAFLNLERYFNDHPYQVAYLRTIIQSDDDQVMRLDIWSDDGFKAWLNGQLIHASNNMRGIKEGQDAVLIQLKKGTNPLMLKVTQDIWGWGAVVQLGSDKAVCPQPAGETLHPKIQVQLNWIPAVTTLSQRVYFGTDSNHLPLLAEVSEAQELQPLSLEAGLRYYWRVDEVLADGSHVKGDLWSFAAGKQVAWWTFDGHAQDQSPQAYHGSLHGNPRWAPGKNNQAVFLDEEEDYITIPPMNLNTNTATITLWVKTEEVIDNPGLVFTRDGSTCAGLWFGTNNNLRYNSNDDSETWTWDSNLFVPNQTWTFAALVVGQEKATLYMHDGTQMKSATHHHGHGVAKFDGLTYIGHDPRWGTVKGAIDEVRIFNYALDKTEIEEIFSNTSIETL